MKRMKEKVVYPVKLFKGDYKRALKKCRELSKEEGHNIYLEDVMRGFIRWLADESIKKKDRKALDNLIVTIGDQGNLLRRKEYEKSIDDDSV